MATVHPLPRQPESADSLFARLLHLLRLEFELGLAESRQCLVTVAIAVIVALVAVVALIAALVVLVAGAFAPLFGAHWQHLIVAGGGTVIVAAAGILWSVLRLRHFPWPRQTLTSFEENWRWLGAQLRSRLTLR